MTADPMADDVADDVAEARDAAAIRSGEWPDRPTAAAGRDGRFQVVYRQSALDAIHLHGQTRTDVEVGGVLIGTGCRDARGPYLLVEACIPALDANSRSTNVTFTADAWHSIQTVMDRDYPDKKMVGWYHTHPGFGIFLSGMDLFICENFFNLPWQVAFVYDPLGGDEGNFVWRDNAPVREPVLLEDDVTPAAGAVPLMPLAEAMTGSDPVGGGVGDRVRDFADGTLSGDAGGPPLPGEAAERLQSQVIELMERVGRLERRLRLLLVTTVAGLTLAAATAIIYWPGGPPWSPTTTDPQPAGQSAPQPTPTNRTPPARPVSPRGHP